MQPHTSMGEEGEAFAQPCGTQNIKVKTKLIVKDHRCSHGRTFGKQFLAFQLCRI